VRKILQSKEARLALAEIFLYTLEHWGNEQAESYLQRILNAFSKLATNPAMGQLHGDYPDRFRVLVIGSHTIIYFYSKETLYIAAVLHSSMDIATRLKRLKATFH
jgi:toxin ParE1/3/4